MLKELIAHIQETTQARIYAENGHTYTVDHQGNYAEIRPQIDRPEAYPVNSLDALVQLVRTEGILCETPLYITVPSPLEVRCAGSFRTDPEAVRRVYYIAQAPEVPGFQDGFLPQEEAIIRLRSQFAPNEGTDYLLDLLSRISKDSNVISRDNGVSQEVEARQGISLNFGVKVRPIVALRPYRTFPEVEQPESEFLVRLDGEGNVGLFEADGGMWKLRARETVRDYLAQALQAETDAGQVIVAV